MKKILTAVLVLLTTNIFAQTDTTKQKANKKISIEINTLKKYSKNGIDSASTKAKKITTNWWVLDLGFCHINKFIFFLFI